MGETEFILYLDQAHENRYRHYHKWKKNKIVEFVVQYEVCIKSKWYPVLRYDSAHGIPHRDLLHPDGRQEKDLFPNYSNAEVLTIGQRDIWATRHY